VAALAVCTLAIGIGLNTAIFSSVESVLLRPLAFRDPDRLVTLVQTPGGATRGGVGAWTAREIASRSRTLQSVSAYDDAQATLVEDGQAEIVRGMRVSVDFFDTLGVPMALGRGFDAGEDRIACANVIVLTHTLWTNRFGADPNIIGRVLQLNGVPHHVIGVLPASFRPLRMTNPAETPTYYMPLIDSRSVPACRACVGTRAIARVQPSATLLETQTETRALMRALVKEYPHDYAADTSIAVVPLRAALVGGVKTALWAVFGAVGLVLVIACANVASLQLARTTDRARQFAVQSALGASRRQIARALLIESGMLTLVGAAAGIAIGWAATRYAAALAPPRAATLRGSDARRPRAGVHDRHQHTHGDCRRTPAGVVVGARGRQRRFEMRDRSDEVDAPRVTDGHHRRGDRDGLCARRRDRVARANGRQPGASRRRLRRAQCLDAYADRSERFARGPAAILPAPHGRGCHCARRHAGRLTSNVPLSHTEPAKFRLDQDFAIADADLHSADMFIVAGDYFGALRIPLARGRLLTRRDGVEDPPAALVSASFAARYFPSADPIGQRIRLGTEFDHGPWLLIVGVVGDVRSIGLDRDPDVAVYQSQATYTFHYTRLVARTAGDPTQVEGAVRATIRSLDPLQPIFHVQPMADYVSASIAERRFTLMLIAVLGLLALLLAVIGVYGVTSYSVAQRTSEMGIRAALGATHTDLLSMVLRECSASITVGIGIGLALSMMAARAIATLLFGVQANDPVTLAGAASLLAGAALMGCYLPARRASRIDPFSALARRLASRSFAKTFNVRRSRVEHSRQQTERRGNLRCRRPESIDGARLVVVIDPEASAPATYNFNK
jgi:putative ABC transport system permease protein